MTTYKVNKLEAEKSHINNLILISFRLTKLQKTDNGDRLQLSASVTKKNCFQVSNVHL